MPFNDNIFLIGPMGAGKSSIGLQLSKLSNMSFYDSDRELEKNAGVDIDWIYDVEGHKGLQQREQETILSLIKHKPCIISTGGGSVTIPAVHKELTTAKIVIYLKVPFEAQLQRTTRRPQGRPLLNKGNHKQQLIEINKKIEPIYEELATNTYNATKMTPATLAKKIWNDIKK
jgi:shikimate kinase